MKAQLHWLCKCSNISWYMIRPHKYALMTKAEVLSQCTGLDH